MENTIYKWMRTEIAPDFSASAAATVSPDPVAAGRRTRRRRPGLFEKPRKSCWKWDPYHENPMKMDEQPRTSHEILELKS